MELYASFNCGCSRAHWNSPWLCNASTLVIVSISNALIPLVNFTVLVWILGLVQDTNHYAFTSIFLILCLYIFWIPLIPYLCTRDAGIVLNVTGWLPCVFPLNLKLTFFFLLCVCSFEWLASFTYMSCHGCCFWCGPKLCQNLKWCRA